MYCIVDLHVHNFVDQFVRVRRTIYNKYRTKATYIDPIKAPTETPVNVGRKVFMIHTPLTQTHVHLNF